MERFDIKDVFSWSNAEEAKQYIGKECYFADSIFTLQDNINNNKVYILEKVANNDKTDVTSLFIFLGPVSEFRWGLCLPADKVKEVENLRKYRPFKSIDEFKRETGFDLLSIVHYRYTIEKTRNLSTTGFGVITDFNTTGDDTDYITIGDISFNLNELFNYEYLNKHGNWQPFGVLDES